MKPAVEIQGITHLDYSPISRQVHFTKGGVGHPYVQILIQSLDGEKINSTFLFNTIPKSN